MARTHKRSTRPAFDDLEGRHLLSHAGWHSAERSFLAPAVTTHLARPMSVEAHSGLAGMAHQGSSRFANLTSAAGVQPSVRAGTYFLRDKATGFNLDSNAAGQVYTLPGNGGAYQKWVFRPTGDGHSFYLVDDATGFFLDSNYNGDVYTLPGNGGPYQRWLPDLRPDGYYYLFNIATGRVLDSNAAGQVYTLPHNGGSYQGWRLTGTTP